MQDTLFFLWQCFAYQTCINANALRMHIETQSPTGWGDLFWCSKCFWKRQVENFHLQTQLDRSNKPHKNTSANRKTLLWCAKAFSTSLPPRDCAWSLQPVGTTCLEPHERGYLFLTLHKIKTNQILLAAVPTGKGHIVWNEFIFAVASEGEIHLNRKGTEGWLYSHFITFASEAQLFLYNLKWSPRPQWECRFNMWKRESKRNVVSG